MPDHSPSCEEYARASGVSRRRFLAGVAATGTTAVTTSLFGQAVRQASFGATTGGNVMVVLSFRGGMDGLGMVVPYADPAYYTARPRIAVPSSQLLRKDGFFGLHPDLAPLGWLWDAGQMAAVHAVGMPVPNRSHFEAMEEIEDADPTSGVRRGWINRMVGIDTGSSALEAVHLGDSLMPTLVSGPTATMAATTVDDMVLTGADRGWRRQRRAHLQTVWGSVPGPLGAAARKALATVAVSTPVAETPYRPAVAYPEDHLAGDLAAALKDTARLIKADIGTEVVSVDFGSWDMHDGYGTLDWGEMQGMVSAFARALNAFMRDLGALRQRVTVVTISEFGRRVAENGNRGLDHGWGSAMLLLGGGVVGGYHGQWPGLAVGSLVDGDLAVTTDYRDVLGEVVEKRFTDKPVSGVFPGLTYRPRGVLRRT